MSKYLFTQRHKVKDKVLDRINEKDVKLLFLDYDGTLAPFRKDPSRAYPLPGITDVINDLNRREDYCVSLISGRELEDLKSMVDLPNLNYAGNHGLKITMKDGSTLDRARQNVDNLDEIKKLVIERFSVNCEQNKYTLEDKGSVFTLHLSSNSDRKKVEKYLKSLIPADYEVLTGRKNVEVRPSGWNKGKAVNLMINKLCNKNEIDSFLPIYIGDDSTDEDAFGVLTKGISIYVKNEDDLDTAADYYVEDPEEVLNFLNILKTLP